MKVTAMVLIDLSKAFDSICHSILLNRLQALGTSMNALHWFQKGNKLLALEYQHPRH